MIAVIIIIIITNDDDDDGDNNNTIHGIHYIYYRAEGMWVD